MAVSWEADFMTDVIYHEYQRVNRNTLDHSYLIDIGEDIEIQQVMEYRYKVFDSVILKPPHPKTRFFEIAIRVGTGQALISDRRPSGLTGYRP